MEHSQTIWFCRDNFLGHVILRRHDFFISTHEVLFSYVNIKLFFVSQYHVLPLSCGDLFDVTLLCGVFVEIRWIVGLWSSLSMRNIWISSGFFCVWLSYLCKSLWIISLVWPTRLIFLAMEKCLALGSILRCPFPVTVGAARHVLYCCHRG